MPDTALRAEAINDEAGALTVVTRRADGGMSLMQFRGGSIELSASELKRLVAFAYPPVTTTPAKYRLGQLHSFASRN